MCTEDTVGCSGVAEKQQMCSQDLPARRRVAVHAGRAGEPDPSRCDSGPLHAWREGGLLRQVCSLARTTATTATAQQRGAPVQSATQVRPRKPVSPWSQRDDGLEGSGGRSAGKLEWRLPLRCMPLWQLPQRSPVPWRGARPAPSWPAIQHGRVHDNGKPAGTGVTAGDGHKQ